MSSSEIIGRFLMSLAKSLADPWLTPNVSPELPGHSLRSARSNSHIGYCSNSMDPPLGSTDCSVDRSTNGPDIRADFVLPPRPAHGLPQIQDCFFGASHRGDRPKSDMRRKRRFSRPIAHLSLCTSHEEDSAPASE